MMLSELKCQFSSYCMIFLNFISQPLYKGFILEKFYSLAEENRIAYNINLYIAL